MANQKTEGGSSKRKLDVPEINTRKKMQLTGYIIFLGNINRGNRSKRPYYNIQIQTNALDTSLIIGLNMDKHQKLEEFCSLSTPVCIGYKKSLKDNTLFFR